MTYDIEIELTTGRRIHLQAVDEKRRDSMLHTHFMGHPLKVDDGKNVFHIDSKYIVLIGHRENKAGISVDFGR